MERKFIFDVRFYFGESVRIELSVPEGVKVNKIMEDIALFHETAKTNGRYKKHGEHASTLFDYLCERRGWEWRYAQPGIRLELN